MPLLSNCGLSLFLTLKAEIVVLCRTLKCLRKSIASTHLSHHTHLRAMKRFISVCELHGHAGPVLFISASSVANQGTVLISHLLSLAEWDISDRSLHLKGWLIFGIMRNFAFMKLDFDDYDLFEPRVPQTGVWPPITVLIVTSQNA